MRILYFYRSLAVWGGIERIMVEKMNQLATFDGYDVYMLTADQGNHPVPYQLDKRIHLKDLGINLHHQYRYWGIIKLIIAFLRRKRLESRFTNQIAEIRPDIIVCVPTGYAESVLRVSKDTPVVMESHSICLRTFNQKGIRQKLRSRILKKELHKARMIVALTSQDGDEWRKLYPHVTVIPNMVHLNPTEQFSDLSQKRVIFVGRLDYQKRGMEIIKIWQKVWPQHKDWHLDIYGEGELKKQLEKETEQLSMNIHINKPTQHIFDAYRASSFLVLTSLFEPFGLVMPEAMSCGLPVVAYDCPYGPRSIITEGEDGFLIPMDNKEIFAERMDQLMSDAELRMKMGKHAIAAAQRYSAEAIMPMWTSLFEKLTVKKNG